LALSLESDPQTRPAVITEILAGCCSETDETLSARRELAWDLRLGARIERLLRIVQLTESSDSLPILQTCPHPVCRQRFEIAIAYMALFTHARTANPEDGVLPFPVDSNRTIHVRLPTGRDQQSWRVQRYPNADAALTTMVNSLLVEADTLETLSAKEWFEPLATALAEADPLVPFEITTSCPHCEHPVELPVDLEAAALLRLAVQRRRVLLDVHEFALRYGWTEEAVLKIPPSRRAEYRRLADADERTRS
jgi:hypothetical protein